MVNDDTPSTLSSSSPSTDRRFGFQAKSIGASDVVHGDADQRAPSIRKHLGFLSANNFNIRTIRATGTKQNDEEDTVELIKQEITALRERVSSIDRANRTQKTRRDPLRLDLDSSGDLQELSKTLIHIQAGLVAIEGERRYLVNKTEKQQRENNTLQQKLEQQQQEIHTCRNRANDRKREATHLREMNQELSQKVIELKMERSLFDATREENEVLRQKLCDSEQIKLTLDEQCQAMKGANDKARASLSSCVKALGKLSKRKQECEEENDKLHSDLREKSLEVERLSRKVAAITRTSEVPTETQEKLRMLENDLCRKDSEILSLREGIDSQMQELMTTSSELQRLQDEHKLMQGLRDEVSALRHQRNALQESLDSKETTIAEISAQLLKLDLEREYTSRETKTHRSPLRALVTRCDQAKSSPACSPSNLLRLGLSEEALAEVEACFAKDSKSGISATDTSSTFS